MMFWRLMATIMMMSDTGSIAIVQHHTDWPTERGCKETVQTHYKQGTGNTATLGTHNITMRITATCIPIR